MTYDSRAFGTVGFGNVFDNVFLMIMQEQVGNDQMQHMLNIMVDYYNGDYA